MAGGAKINPSVGRVQTTGVRSPQYIGQLGATPPFRLQPFMAAIVRPGETIAGISMQGESNFRRLLQTATLPVCYGEVGLWRVPLSLLGQDFMHVLGSTSQNFYEHARENRFPLAGVGTAGGSHTQFGRSQHGPTSMGLESRNRPWAGEIGLADDDTATSGVNLRYLPLVSHSTFQIAEAYYDMDWTSQFTVIEDVTTGDDLFQEPPALGPYIRGASQMSVLAGQQNLDSFATSEGIGSLLERISLLERSERTWTEYLASNGTPPGMASSIPQNIMLKQGVLQPYGSPVVNGNVDADTIALVDLPTDLESHQAAVTSSLHVPATVPGDPNTGYYSVVDNAGLSQVGRSWDLIRKRNMRIWEPSVVIGTFAWWPILSRKSNFAHILDATRFVSAGHYGDSGMGDLDESDFIHVGEYRDVDGAVLPPDSTGAQPVVGTQRIANQLNHYLHGDTFSFPTAGAPLGLAGSTAGTAEFDFRGPNGRVLIDNNKTPNTKLSTRLHVLTDMIGN